MFYENPSTRTMLEGFMVKEHLTFSDFESLFGFDKMNQGIPYEMLQACVVLYYDKINISRTIININNRSVCLEIMDNNNALIHIDFVSVTSIDIKFNYRTDNFPSIEFALKMMEKRWVRRSRNIDFTMSFPREVMMELISIMVSFLANLLWISYSSKDE